MTYEQFVGLVKDLGFPIFVAGYLLLRMDSLLRDLIGEVKKLTGAILASAKNG